MSRVLVFLLVGCNTAPTDYDLAWAPGALAPFSGPTNTICVKRGDTDVVVDGYFFCAGPEALRLVPVDDPILQRCGDMAAKDVNGRAKDVMVLSVFDGVRARAYATDKLTRRELVHDWWGDEPLLIDF